MLHLSSLPRREADLQPAMTFPKIDPARITPTADRLLIPESLESEWLVHDEDIHPIATEIPPNVEIANAAYRDHILRKMTAPRKLKIWEVEGPATISNRRGEVFVNGYLFTPTARVVNSPHNPAARASFWRMAGKLAPSVADRVVHMRCGVERVYFHAFEDISSRLYFARKTGLAQGATAIAPGRWKSDGANARLVKGYAGAMPLVFQKPWQVLNANRVIVVHKPAYYADTWRSVADTVEPKAPARKFGPRIVLERTEPGAVKRDCDGYGILAQELVARGYDRLDPASLTLAEQKHVFSQAEHVVGVNGSAFTNMVFSPVGKTLFDSIVPQHQSTATFACLSASLGHRYRAHLVKSAGRRRRLTATLDRETAQTILCAAS